MTRITTPLGVYYRELPAVDEWGTPTEKMPRCPRCNADELGMLTANGAYCYMCYANVLQRVQTQEG